MAACIVLSLPALGGSNVSRPGIVAGAKTQGIGMAKESIYLFSKLETLNILFMDNNNG